MLDALTSALKHPVSIGAGVGGLGGAGVGYLSADQEDPNRWRKALVGGATGAALGGFTGALAVPSMAPSEQVQEYVQNITARLQRQAVDVRKKAIREGYGLGATTALETVQNDPAAMKSLFADMDPGLRDNMMASIGAVPIAKMKATLKNPETIVGILENMSPSLRESVSKRLDKGWLTKMFGG